MRVLPVLGAGTGTVLLHVAVLFRDWGFLRPGNPFQYCLPEIYNSVLFAVLPGFVLVSLGGLIWAQRAAESSLHKADNALVAANIAVLIALAAYGVASNPREYVTCTQLMFEESSSALRAPFVCAHYWYASALGMAAVFQYRIPRGWPSLLARFGPPIVFVVLVALWAAPAGSPPPLETPDPGPPPRSH